MVSLFIGLLMVAGSLYVALPFDWALNWWQDILPVLKGGTPILLLGMGGMFCVLGFGDIRDRAQARKERKRSNDL